MCRPRCAVDEYARFGKRRSGSQCILSWPITLPSCCALFTITPSVRDHLVFSFSTLSGTIDVIAGTGETVEATEGQEKDEEMDSFVKNLSQVYDVQQPLRKRTGLTANLRDTASSSSVNDKTSDHDKDTEEQDRGRDKDRRRDKKKGGGGSVSRSRDRKKIRSKSIDPNSRTKLESSGSPFGSSTKQGRKLPRARGTYNREEDDINVVQTPISKNAPEQTPEPVAVERSLYDKETTASYQKKIGKSKF